MQQSVSKNSSRKQSVERAISHVCGLPPLSQHPVKGLGIIASGLVDPLLNLQHLHRLLPKQVSLNCGVFTSFFTPKSYRLTTKLPAFTQEVGLVWARGNTAARLGTDWVLPRTQGAAAEWHHSPPYEQPGETRTAKLKHPVLLLKLPHRGAHGLQVSLLCSSEFSRLHVPFPPF